LPGGVGSVPFAAALGFSRPAANLPSSQKPLFYAGQALARQPWVKAPSSTDARDGLGPLYNARSCLVCHHRGGRGTVNGDGVLGTGTLIRLSQVRVDGTAAPDPIYGSQLQLRTIDASYTLGGTAGQIPAEAQVVVEWIPVVTRYPDGQSITLRRPTVHLSQLGYGPLAPTTVLGLRHASPLYGLGLIDLIDTDDLMAMADPSDEDGDGISGRANRVWDRQRQTTVVGRFGWKANQPSLRQQVAAALAFDMGITSRLFPASTCSEDQSACRNAPNGASAGGHEISESLLDLIVDYNRSIAVPQRRKPSHPLVVEGQRHFVAMGCVGCHVPTQRTGQDSRFPHLSEQTIWPYTDLLLHDMGPDLADGRPDFDASGVEWRTPPLWGVGLSRAVHRDAGLLHDGRARTVEEAILWHGGEAQESRDAFMAAKSAQRRALLAFVRSL
ncbi:MAG: di-heme oxidoredictase family protein, partial [Myxococcota bacterium]